MNKKLPDVSVVCANHNNAEYLPDFFDSFLKSSVSPKELILVDDGSTDDSAKIASTYAEKLPYLKIIFLNKNHGFANALNIGIKKASGDFILRIDPDDKISPERIALQRRFLLDNPTIDVVGGHAEYFLSHNSKILRKSTMPLTHNEITKAFMAGDNGLMHGTVTARASAFRAHKYNQKCVPAEDYDIFSRMIAAGLRAANIPEAVTYVRIHSESVTNNLRYSTVKKTMQLREVHYGIREKRLQTMCEFISMRCYRRYLFDESWLRYFSLLLAALLRPMRAVRVLKRFITPTKSSLNAIQN